MTTLTLTAEPTDLPRPSTAPSVVDPNSCVRFTPLYPNSEMSAVFCLCVCISLSLSLTLSLPLSLPPPPPPPPPPLSASSPSLFPLCLGSYPVAINRNVSPLGNHTLTVSVKDDEEFTAETTVPYFLEEDTKPTGGASQQALSYSLLLILQSRVNNQSYVSHQLASK